jgi:hypothetical protein
MYNINKGANTLEESEFLEPLHTCLRELLELEKQGKSLNYRWTDHDVIAATLLYATILSNALVHNLKDSNASINMAADLSQHYSALIKEVTLGMSGIDVSNYFKEREGKKK